MKTRFSLSFKITLWFGLNLLLLLVLAGGAVLAGGGVDGLLRKPVGDRLQQMADVMASELNQSERAVREEIVARYESNYGLRIVIFDLAGGQRFGASIELPSSVQEKLRRRTPSRTRPPPRERAEDLGPPESHPQANPPPPRRERPPPRVAAAEEERVVVKSAVTGEWWVGARIPLPAQTGDPRRPGILFVVTDSIWSLSGLVDFRPVIWAGAAVALVSILWWTPLLLGITRSLKRLTAATEQIAQGRFETRVATSRSDEIGQLGDSVNRMAGRLDSLVNGQKKFLGDIAHELGSPVARLQVGVGILEDRVPTALIPAVEDVREEVQEMGDLIAELLAFTQAGMRAPGAQLDIVDLREVVDRAVAKEGRGMDVWVELEGNTRVLGDAVLLTRAVGNLIRNVRRHAGEGMKVEISIDRTLASSVCLVIADHGPGVPPAALARLGEPFYRPEAARTREGGGVGLGLSIVRSAVEAGGGTVKFVNRPKGGFEVRLELVPEK